MGGVAIFLMIVRERTMPGKEGCQNLISYGVVGSLFVKTNDAIGPAK